jgi:hypothetical protein
MPLQRLLQTLTQAGQLVDTQTASMRPDRHRIPSYRMGGVGDRKGCTDTNPDGVRGAVRHSRIAWARPAMLRTSETGNVSGGASRVNPSDRPKAVAHTASSTPDRTNW